MMHDQGPRNNDEHVDVQDLLRSLPSVAAPDNFEQKLFERIEAENLNLAHHLTNLPKVPAVADFTDRLHWSIAVHNQINGGMVAQAVEEGVVAVESTGGRVWLRTGLGLLAVAIGFGSWAVMGDGSPSATAPVASGGTGAVPTVASGTASSSSDSKGASSGQNRLSVDPGTVGNGTTPMLSFVTPSQQVQKMPNGTVSMGGPIMNVSSMPAPSLTTQMPQQSSTTPTTIGTVVSSAERTALGEYGTTSAASPAQTSPRLAGSSDTSAVHEDAPAVGVTHSIETGAPGMNLDDPQPPTDSIHTGEHRTDDTTASGRL